MALFHHRGLLRVGGSVTSRGLLGLDFTGRIAGGTTVEGRRAILPEITGTSSSPGSASSSSIPTIRFEPVLLEA